MTPGQRYFARLVAAVYVFLITVALASALTDSGDGGVGAFLAVWIGGSTLATVLVFAGQL